MGSAKRLPDPAPDNRGVFLDAVAVLPEALRDAWVFLGASKLSRRPEPAGGAAAVSGPASSTAGSGRYRRARPKPCAVGSPPPSVSSPSSCSPDTLCLLDDHLPPAHAGRGGSRDVPDERRPRPGLRRTAAAPRQRSPTPPTRGWDCILPGRRHPAAIAAAALSSRTYTRTPGQMTRCSPCAPAQPGPRLGGRRACLSGLRPHPLTHVGQSHGPDSTEIAQSDVDGITRTYRLAGHDVTVRADYNLVENQIILDQVASSHEVRRAGGQRRRGPGSRRLLGEQVTRRRCLLLAALQVRP